MLHGAFHTMAVPSVRWADLRDSGRFTGESRRYWWLKENTL